VICFVDPAAPEQAVLNRDLRPEMLLFKGVFGLVFGGVGIGGYVGMYIASRRQREQSVRQSAAPDEPWLWRSDWTAGVVESQQGYGALFMGGFALLWNAISWPVVLAFAMSDDRKPWYTLLAIALFPLVGVVLASGALVMLARWRRFRGSHFRMAHVPGVVGGRLAGVIIVPRRLSPDDGFRLRLVCTKTDSDGEHNTDRIIWESEKLIARTLDSSQPGETAIPVSFAIPSACVATSDEALIKWHVECKAALPGPDLALAFEVPVFRTADSRDEVDESDADSLTADFELVESLEQTLARQGIRCYRGHHPDEFVFRTPPFRNAGTCVSLSLFSLVWVGACVVMWWFQMWLFAVVFTAFALILVPITISTLLAHRTLTIRGDRWQVQSGLWPLVWSTQQFEAADIKRFSLKSNMSSGQTIWNNLLVHLRHRAKPIALSHGLVNRRVEQIWLADLERRAGLGKKGDKGDASRLELSREL
jgi:hypothetical protein